MTKKELYKHITNYMKKNNVGFLQLTASTDITRTKAKIDIYEEAEEDIQDQGYKC